MLVRFALYLLTMVSRMLRRILRRSLTKSTVRPGTYGMFERQVMIFVSHSSHGIGLFVFSGPRHVIVGRNFGSYVTHETKHFIYFYLGQVAILLFKSG